MRELTAEEVRASFVNCSRGEAKRLPLPKPWPRDWETLDLLGWSDPGAPGAAYLVVPEEAAPDGHPGPVGLVLRVSTDRRSAGRKNMCSLCATVHSASDVALMVAARPGARGRQGNTVGDYLCADLACSRYARGTKRPERAQPVETLSPEERVDRLRGNLARFVRRVLAD